VPLHFGGMSDAFQPAERHHRVTLAYLRTLAERNYPTLISTKGDMATEPEYLSELIANPNTIVQVSLVSVEDRSARLIEPSATPPSRLLKMMEQLSRVGVTVTCRLQPYLADISGPLQSYISSVASTGARHISIEHLKVPVEGTTNSVIEDTRARYRVASARRDGREYVLAASEKIDVLLRMKDECRKASVYFGCADNEYQYLSDSWACCSGADLFPGFENFYRYQIAYAVRKSLNRDIMFSAISDEWRPMGSIDRYLNSRSRLSSRTGMLGTVEQHIRYRWNSSTAPGNPQSFAGVYQTGRYTDDGNRIYAWSASQV
jgi:DNA repair photolyase